MSEKLVTFIIPVYNTGEYLRIALDSVINQTHSNFKIIAVNDGSTDKNTLNILDEYSKKYSSLITCVNQENKGLGGARNTGIMYCDTEYLLFLDSDDMMNLEFVELFNKFRADNEVDDCDMIFTLPETFDNLTNCYLKWNDYVVFNQMINKQSIYSKGNFDKAYSLEVSSCRKVFKTEFLKNIGFKFEENVKFEDVYPHFYAVNNASKIAFMNGTSWYYRINRPGQITSCNDRDRLDIIKVFDELREYVYNECDSEYAKIEYIKKLVEFSIWSENSIRESLRKELSEGISGIFKKIPSKYIKEYKKNEPKKMNRTYINIKMHNLNFLVYEYKYRAILSSRILKKNRG